MVSREADQPTSPAKHWRISISNQSSWWFADCPRHGRTPHIAVLGGICEKCAAEQQAKLYALGRTRQ
jgi:hypothetical protein